MSHLPLGRRVPFLALAVCVALLMVVANVSLHSVYASPAAPSSVTVLWSDSTALASWTSVPNAAQYRVSLIRVSDLGLMEQKVVPASQRVFDAQGIWPGEQYAVAVEAIDSTGAAGPATLSAPGQAAPISHATYNGFLDTENVAQGQIATNLWDVRLGQDNGPNQGGTFVNNQMHYHLEAGNQDGNQTFSSMRARAPFNFSGGRTLTVHGEVDLKGDVRNWFGAVLAPQALGGDQLIDLQDRPLEARSVPQIELFDDQNGLHLLEALPSGAYEVGTPYLGGYHTNNVRDEVVWKISISHVTVLIDGKTAFDANWPAALPFTAGYLHLMAENYPDNGGGIFPPNACDDPMGDCNVWHIDNWGFDAASGTQMPASVAYWAPGCAPYPSREKTVVTFDSCGRLDNSGGYGFLSVDGQTASTTFTLPSSFTASNVASAGLAFDENGLNTPSRLSVSVNGSPFVALGYVPARANSWQAMRVALPVSALHAGANTVTLRDSVAGAWDTPQVANLELETLLSSAYVAPALPVEPAPIGTWGGSAPTPTPTATQPPSPTPTQTPSPTPTPTPITINGVPCTVTLNGQQQTGTCSGTFQP